MSSIAPPVAVPLYYLPKDAGGPDVTVDSDVLEDGYVTVNSDNYVRLCADGLGDLGMVCVRLLSTIEEAEAVAVVLERGAQTEQLPDGSGVVMWMDGTGSHEMHFNDKRRTSVEGATPVGEAFGSWDLDRHQMLTMQKYAEEHREDTTRAWAQSLVDMAERVGPEATKQLQVQLQTIPGASVSFASFDIGALEEAYGVDFENEAEAHSVLFHGPQKFGTGPIEHDIEEYLMERLNHLLPDSGPAL